MASPRSAASASATRRRSSDAGADDDDLGTVGLDPLRLMAGASEGMTMTAGTPNSRAARATPCAWLPEEYVMTPAARASCVSDAPRRRRRGS